LYDPNVLVPDQYSARPSSFLDCVASLRLLRHAPQLAKLELIGCNLISLVHSALLVQTEPCLAAGGECEGEGKEDEPHVHENEHAKQEPNRKEQGGVNVQMEQNDGNDK
jgi:hypothetical protein